jgi:hypothetical protein
MTAERKQRASDSALVQSITHVTYGAETRELSTPDGCWDLVFMRRQGSLMVLQTGLTTRPVQLANGPGDEYLAVSFRAGVFMPRLPGVHMVDKGLLRPSSSDRAFWLEGDELEVPDFENAEGLVQRLSRLGQLAQDEIVTGVVSGSPRAISPRSVQRHFIHALGVTAKGLEQIQRANQAVQRLEQGGSAVEVALALGYSDQAHMTRSLKRIMGRTPGEILRGAHR